MIPYTDQTFDEFYGDFTQINQPIPSSKGMPAFEIVDIDECSEFLLNYDNFDSVTLPDFTGDRVASYLRVKDVVTTIKYFGRAFPDTLANDGYFKQCPAEFNRYKMSSFCKIISLMQMA